LLQLNAILYKSFYYPLWWLTEIQPTYPVYLTSHSLLTSTLTISSVLAL
jgi:hypothetical protein